MMTLAEAFPILAKAGPITSHTRLVPVQTCRQVLGYLHSTTSSTEENAGRAVGLLLRSNAGEFRRFENRDKAVIRRFGELIEVCRRFPDLVSRETVLKLSSVWPTAKHFESLANDTFLSIKGAAHAHLAYGEREEKRLAEEAKWKADRDRLTADQRAEVVRKAMERLNGRLGGKTSIPGATGQNERA